MAYRKRRLNMFYLRNSLMVLVMATVSFAAGAQEIYKTVNEDGVVEYSDTPSPQAQEIEVKPNVVETNPEKYVAPAPEAPPAKPEESAEPEQESVEVNDVDRLEREKRRAAEHEAAEGSAHEGQVEAEAHPEARRRRLHRR
jgi:hypothetical protein